MNNKETIILVPSYEPDELLVNTVKGLFEAGFKVLIVNDGSANEFDETFKDASKYAEYIGYEKNHGKGFALKYGYKHILENYKDIKYVITCDGDGQHALKDIINVNEKLNETGELVLGVRIFDKSVPFRSKAGNLWSRITRGLATKQYTEDDQCGLRGFPVRYLPELIKIRGNRYEYEMNQLTSFQLRQYTIVRVPIEVIYLDNNSRSHFSQFKDTMRIQFKIFFKGLPALICLLLLIAGLITLYHYGYGYDYYHLLVLGGYIAAALLYIVLLTIIQPSQKPLRRIGKELLYAFIKGAFVFALMWLFCSVIGLTYYVGIPLFIFIACWVNLLLPQLKK